MAKTTGQFRPKRNPREKTRNETVGDVHFVHPFHVVPKKQRNEYIGAKGNTNKRPVAIVKQNRDKTVEVAKITSTKPKQENISKGHKVKLGKTKLPKQSWIDTDTLKASESTGKNFEVGRSPLNKKRAAKLHPDDMRRRNLIAKRKKSK